MFRVLSASGAQESEMKVQLEAKQQEFGKEREAYEKTITQVEDRSMFGDVTQRCERLARAFQGSLQAKRGSDAVAIYKTHLAPALRISIP